MKNYSPPLMFAGSDSARADTFTILFDEGSTVFQEADWTGTYTLILTHLRF
jgi:hypothetical protein